MPPDNLEDLTPDEIAQAAATYRALLNNPDTREVALRATRKLNPSLSIPEIDLKDQARAAFGETNKKVESLENQLRERDARDRIERERRTLKEQGFDADDVAEIEKIMTTEQIPSYGTASKYYANARQLATPTPSNGESQPGTTWDLPAEAMAAGKNGRQGLNKFARQQAESAMAEIRSGRIKLQ